MPRVTVVLVIAALAVATAAAAVAGSNALDPRALSQARGMAMTPLDMGTRAS